MVDEAWRDLERRLRLTPDDDDLRRRAVEARERSGVDVPGWMAAPGVRPARPFAAERPLEIVARLASGDEISVGHTGARPVELPAHRAFWAAAHRVDAVALESVRDARVPGLALLDGKRGTLRALRDLPDLELLIVRPADRLAADDLAALADAVPSLRAIELDRPGRIGDAELAALARSASLESIALRGFDPSGAGDWRVTAVTGIAALVELPRLRELVLETRTLADAWIEALPGAAPRLERVGLAGCLGFTADAISSLGRLEVLRELSIESCRLDGRALASLVDLSSLRSLRLAGLGALEGALEELVPPGRLERLVLDGRCHHGAPWDELTSSQVRRLAARLERRGVRVLVTSARDERSPGGTRAASPSDGG